MLIEVRSDKPISELRLKKIQYIFNESLCPNESLRNSIPDFTSYDGDQIVQLGEGDNYVEFIEVDER